MTSEQRASDRYSVELASRNPKWHFFRVLGTVVGVPYERPLPYEAVDLREGDPTPRFRLLITDKTSGDTLSRRKLSGAREANEAMAAAEKDLEELSLAEFRQKYQMRG